MTKKNTNSKEESTPPQELAMPSKTKEAMPSKPIPKLIQAITELRAEIIRLKEMNAQSKKSEMIYRRRIRKVRKAYKDAFKVASVAFSKAYKKEFLIFAFLLIFTTCLLNLWSQYLFQSSRQRQLESAVVAINPQFLEKTEKKLQSLNKENQALRGQSQVHERDQNQLAKANQILRQDLRRLEKKATKAESQWEEFKKRFLRVQDQNYQVLTTEGWKNIQTN